MRVALYLRYSSNKQTEQSIEGQDRVCRDWCRANGHQVVAVYIDRATSASKDTEKRVQFLKMIDDSHDRGFDAVVVYSLSRFARDRFDAAVYRAELKKSGVKVFSATEGITDSPESIILEAVLEGFAEYEAKELARKVRRGMHESAEKGNSTGGIIPLGYKSVDKKLVVDEAGAQIVREAFDLYANGSSVAEIVRRFNEKGYRTSRGHCFTSNSFGTIFHQKKYIGVLEYADVVNEGGIPAIVDRETFDKVQQRLAKNKTAPARGKAKTDYLLSGKIYCGHCGRPMTGDTGRSSTTANYHYYVCSGRKRFHDCKMKAVPKELIEDFVVNEIFNAFTPEVISELADLVVEENERLLAEDGVIIQLLARIKEIDHDIDALTRALAKMPESEAVPRRICELESERKDAVLRLDGAKKLHLSVSREDVFDWLYSFIRGEKEDDGFRKVLVENLITKVTVWESPDDDGWKVDIEGQLVAGSFDVGISGASGHHSAISGTLTVIGPLFILSRGLRRL